MHHIHLVERKADGTSVRDLDLGNDGGSSVYRLKKFRPGEPKYKETWASSPLAPSQQLKHFELDMSQSDLTISIEASTVDAALAALNALDLFFKDARSAQVARYENKPANYFYLETSPSGATKTSKTQILSGDVIRPDSFFDDDILASVIEDLELRINHDPYFSASVYNIINGASLNNGNNCKTDIAASGANSVAGDQDAPLRVSIDGGNTATKRVLIAARCAGDPTLFNHILWAKDATLFNNTVGVADAAFDGNGTGNGTKTTPASTSELLTHRWIVTSNTKHQYGHFVVIGIGKRTADVFSVRLRLGLTDGTNIIYPDDVTDGYTLATPVSVGAHNGNALAFFVLGNANVPSPNMGAKDVYGLVYELYVTCSNLTGSPMLYLDDARLYPVGESPNDGGYADLIVPLALGAAGVGGVVLSALPDALTNSTGVYLVNGSGVVTFSGSLEYGAALWAKPKQATRLFFAALDDANSQIDQSLSLTVSVDHELRHGGVIGI